MLDEQDRFAVGRDARVVTGPGDLAPFAGLGIDRDDAAVVLCLVIARPFDLETGVQINLRFALRLLHLLSGDELRGAVRLGGLSMEAGGTLWPRLAKHLHGK